MEVACLLNGDHMGSVDELLQMRGPAERDPTPPAGRHPVYLGPRAALRLPVQGLASRGGVAVAMAFGLAAEGGTRNVQQGTRPTESPLHRWISLERAPGAPRWGFFLRAEAMHGYFTRQEAYSRERDPHFHEMSHGVSFLEMLRTRIGSPGLYCLDEPEAALSFSAQIALVGTLHDLAASGAQVLCATHSPVLAALPDAHLLEVGAWGLRETAWDDLELVAHWRRYLEAPMRYLRHVPDSD